MYLYLPFTWVITFRSIANNLLKYIPKAINMTYKLISILLLLVIVAGSSFAQRQHPRYVVKVKTDTGAFTGRLTYIGSSSIEITDRSSGSKSLFYSTDIKTLIVKKPFLYNTATGTANGALVASFLTVVYYSKAYWFAGVQNHSDPAFGRALWSYSLAGAGVGLLYSGFESLFVHKRFQVAKMPHLYDNNRDKLKKYLFY